METGRARERTQRRQKGGSRLKSFEDARAALLRGLLLYAPAARELLPTTSLKRRYNLT